MLQILAYMDRLLSGRMPFRLGFIFASSPRLAAIAAGSTPPSDADKLDESEQVRLALMVQGSERSRDQCMCWVPSCMRLRCCLSVPPPVPRPPPPHPSLASFTCPYARALLPSLLAGHVSLLLPCRCLRRSHCNQLPQSGEWEAASCCRPDAWRAAGLVITLFGADGWVGG